MMREVSIKTIECSRDLAINGAVPAFSTPLHVGRPNIADREAFLDGVAQVLENGWLTNNGPKVQELERRLSDWLGVKHCVAMCNGTIALEIAIRALGLTGEVIVPSWTFVATAHALHWQGITPVFADVDPCTQNLDIESVRRAITSRTTGIIGVHLWGRAAPIDDLQKLADEFGLKLLFDAAHAFGSTYKGRSIGQFGACEVFSFHATKAFSTMEGGAVTTNDDVLADTLRLMRNFGFKGYDNVIHPGTNGKMIEVCAAMGLANLDGFPRITSINKRNHELYRQAFSGIDGVVLLDYDESESNSYHYVVLQMDSGCSVTRDEFIAALHAENILARRYFWPGVHRMHPYCEIFDDLDIRLPVTCDISEGIVVLPTGSAIGQREVGIVASVLRALIGSA